MSAGDHLNPDQFAARRAARDAARDESKSRHPSNSGEELRQEYLRLRADPEHVAAMEKLGQQIRDEMTPDERRAYIKRKNRPRRAD